MSKVKKSKESVAAAEELVKAVPPTPLPKFQVYVICCVQMAEAMNVELLFPFLAFMIEDMGYTGEQLGYHAGILAATFCGAQFCTSVAWGMISDRYGRKFAVVSGTLGAGLGMLIFGFAKTFPQAIVGRIIGGLLCGNLGVVKSFLTEITDDTNRSAAFYLFSLSWAVGSVCAPLIGGLLCKPAEKYPWLFPSGPDSIWVRYPYLLPCLLTVLISVVSAVQCLIFMVETVGVKRATADTQYAALDTQGEMEGLEEGIQMNPVRTSDHTLNVITNTMLDNESRGRSTSITPTDTSQMRQRAMSSDKQNYNNRSLMKDQGGTYFVASDPDVSVAAGTDYDSSLVHRRILDANNSNNNFSHSSSNTSQANSAPHSPKSGSYADLATDNSSYYDSEQPEADMAECTVNKLHFAPGQVVATTGTIHSSVRNRSRSRSTSDGQDRYLHMSTGDIERSLGVLAAPTTLTTHTTHADQTHTISNHGIADRGDFASELGLNEDLSDPEDEETGAAGDQDEPEEEEEICCPGFFDCAARWGRYLSCANKSRSLDTSMESSSHGLMQSASAQSLDSLQSTDSTVEMAHSASGDYNDTNPRGQLSTAAILTQRVVILATLNYGMVCASSILLDETMPLYLKLDTAHGGFGFDSTQIGMLLSTGAAGMMLLTVVCMPLTNGVSNKYMSKMSILVSVPLALSFPLIAWLNNHVFETMSATAHMWLLWPLLILVNTFKNLFSCFTFTSSIIMVNHSVTDEYLGAVNGLGQSLGALARSLGPAVGGLLWSLATKYNFVYLNFIAVTVIFGLNYYVSYLVPDSLDHRKKSKRVSKKR